MRARLALALAALSVPLAPTIARADVESANKYLAEARHELEINSFDDARAKLELAEAELDGVDAAAKVPVAAAIAELKQKVDGGALSMDRAKYQRKLDRAMDEAEGSIGNLVTWNGAANAVNEVFDSPEAQAALPDEIAAARKKFATFKKLHDKKAGAAKAEQAEAAVKDLEAFWAESRPKIATPESPGSKIDAIDDVGRRLEDARRALAGLSADEAATKALAARVDKVGADYAELALADVIKEKAEALARGWESYKDEWAGWEAETKGPSFAEFSAVSSESMSRLNAPKSIALVSRAASFTKNLESDDDYQKVASAPAVKAIVDKVNADAYAARAKVEAFAARVMADAEAAPLDARGIDHLKRFADALGYDLEASDQREPLVARANALVAKFENAGQADGEAVAAFYKAATERAAADWPAMKAKFTCAEGFDPNAPGDFKGKYILIETDNLMGYRFGAGDFPFATTIDGAPIAGKYDPAVAKAVKEVEAKLGRSLGDDDADGRWEVIALVEGSIGKLTQRVDVEGTIKDDAGNTATVTGEKRETVDAPIVTIVAARCGPLAVAK